MNNNNAVTASGNAPRVDPERKRMWHSCVSGKMEPMPQWKIDQMQRNLELRAAMKKWRADNPQYPDAKIVSHGWHGHVVMANVNHEKHVVANVEDIRKKYSNEQT